LSAWPRAARNDRGGVMDKSEEKEKGFKVEDRRRFSSEGELKPEHRGTDEKPQAASAQSTASTQWSASGAGAPVTGASGASTAGRDASAPVEIMFSTFIVGLSTQALIHLGEISDPAGGKPEHDLIGAQQLIDILGMLQEKTRGNLDANEQKLLETILFDLRMKYVEIARQAAH
jgi:hypothetical protein